jgi:hypothetical protein
MFDKGSSNQTHGLADCGRSGNGKMNSKRSTLQKLAPLGFESSLELGLNRALLKRLITEIGIDSDQSASHVNHNLGECGVGLINSPIV